jgi:exodeoxyribonuclease VII small subunit
MKKTGKYSDVLRELEETLERMNRGDVPIDELEETVKEAAKKIRYLRQVLRSTQSEVTKILKDIEEDQTAAEEG